MKRKLIRHFPTGNAPPQKSTLTAKRLSGLQDELYYVDKENIKSNYRLMGLRPVGRFLFFSAVNTDAKNIFSKKRRSVGSTPYSIRLICGKGTTSPKIPHRKGVNKMETTQRRFGREWSQFDRYCRLVLYHEAVDYLREMQRRRDREIPFDAISPEEWDKLCTVDRYPSESYIFSSHGYSLYIDNELVADAFAELSRQKQSILILCFVLDMKDGEISRVMGISRSTVQRHRTSALKELRNKLLAVMPEGG